MKHTLSPKKHFWLHNFTLELVQFSEWAIGVEVSTASSRAGLCPSHR